MILRTSILILIFTTLNFSQDSTNNKYKVDSINITGNSITQSITILRELNFKIGDTVSTKQLKYNRERVFSLGIFSKVEIAPKNNDSAAVINIYVEESWYWYPYPLLTIADKDYKKISYGFDISIKNFRGYNETIRAKALFGYDPSFLLNYNIPFIDSEGKYYFSANTSYSKINNKSKNLENILRDDNFKYKEFSISMLFGRRLDVYTRLGLILGFNYISASYYVKDVMATEGDIDRIPNIGTEFIYDSRDLVQFPKVGTYIDFLFMFKGLGIENVNYQNINLDFRKYFFFDDFITKLRFYTDQIVGEHIPYYDIAYIGFSDRIRGHYNDLYEGTHLYLLSAELSYPIIKDLNLNFEWVPIVPNSLLRYRVGLYVNLFGDTGTNLNKNEKFTWKNLNSGFGLGLTLLILPYNSLRVEVGFNEQLQSQLILNFGSSF